MNLLSVISGSEKCDGSAGDRAQRNAAAAAGSASDGGSHSGPPTGDFGFARGRTVTGFNFAFFAGIGFYVPVVWNAADLGDDSLTAAGTVQIVKREPKSRAVRDRRGLDSADVARDLAARRKDSAAGGLERLKNRNGELSAGVVFAGIQGIVESHEKMRPIGDSVAGVECGGSLRRGWRGGLRRICLRRTR